MSCAILAARSAARSVWEEGGLFCSAPLGVGVGGGAAALLLALLLAALLGALLAAILAAILAALLGALFGGRLFSKRERDLSRD